MKKLLSLLLFLVGFSGVVWAEQAAGTQTSYVYWRWISAAVAVGIACIGGGIAVGQIGAAAMGAMSENPELSGKALPYVGLAEGICLWGFLVALLILFI
ncbi:MAG: ATP synthase subunit C [Spirochaetes bacterium]|nr:ATP synthase subunit C [Spirochaetota bacterium]